MCLSYPQLRDSPLRFPLKKSRDRPLLRDGPGAKKLLTRLEEKLQPVLDLPWWQRILKYTQVAIAQTSVRNDLIYLVEDVKELHAELNFISLADRCVLEHGKIADYVMRTYKRIPACIADEDLISRQIRYKSGRCNKTRRIQIMVGIHTGIRIRANLIWAQPSIACSTRLQAKRLPASGGLNEVPLPTADYLVCDPGRVRTKLLAVTKRKIPDDVGDKQMSAVER